VRRFQGNPINFTDFDVHDSSQPNKDMTSEDSTDVHDSATTTLVNTPECSSDAEEVSKMGELASKTAKTVKNAVLYTFGDAPSYQQDNHYILSGYRGELGTFQRCFHSLLYLHNETGSNFLVCSD